MNTALRFGNTLVDLLDRTKKLDFLGFLALRIFLAPIFLMAGWNKLSALENTSYYFGEFLGIPSPMLMAVIAGSAELAGGIALVLGVALRFMVI